MLLFDPQKRMLASDLLKLSIFDGIRDSSLEAMCSGKVRMKSGPPSDAVTQSEKSDYYS